MQRPTLADFFYLGYGHEGSYASFYEQKDNTVFGQGYGNKNVSFIRNVTMPPRFAVDSKNAVTYFKNYAVQFGLDYSVGGRDLYGESADRESYFAVAMFNLGLPAYVGDVEDLTTDDYRSMTLAQIVSYVLEKRLAIAINCMSGKELAGTVLRSGDMLLCRTNAATTADQLYGIGDLFIYDEDDDKFGKWTPNGLKWYEDVLSPLIIFRPLLELYGLYNIGREDFDAYMNKQPTSLAVNTVSLNQVDYGTTSGSSLPVIDRTSGASGTGGTIDTATAKKYIWCRLMQELNNEYGTAGLMGNLAHESGFSSNNLQNTYEQSLHMTDPEYTAAVDQGTYTNFVHDSAGYGLAQWTYYTRKQNLLNYSKQQGTSIGSLAMQVDFLISELKNSYGSVWSELLSSESVRAASDVVLLNFERPADQSEAVKTRRANSGVTIYNEFHGTSFNEDVIVNVEQQGNASTTSVASSEQAYQATGLLQKAVSKEVYSLDTSSWAPTNWARDWTTGSNFGWRIIDGKNQFHKGIDISPIPYNPTYSDVWKRYTLDDATIVATGYDSSMGNYVTYRPDSTPSVTITEMHYANNSIPSNIVAGAHVSRGTFIGIGGNTGHSYGEHIHFQINVPAYTDTDGKSYIVVDPTAWLSAVINRRPKS